MRARADLNMPLKRRLRPSALNLRRPRLRSKEVRVKGKDLEQALSRVREVFQKADSRLEFSVDPDLDRVVVKVMDGDSGTVIRQIPQQEVIDLAKRLETPTGLLLHHKV
jgi:flagellar protein FlaG